MLGLLKKLFTKRQAPALEADGCLIAFALDVPEKLNLDTYCLGSSHVGGAPAEQDSFHTTESVLWIKNPEQGIELGIKDGILEFVFITVEMYKTPIIYKGRDHFLTIETSISDFIRDFGSPYFRSEEEGTLLFYEPLSGKIEIQAEFIEDKLAHLLITSQSVMADDERRLSYGVTKPWPPDQKS